METNPRYQEEDWDDLPDSPDIMLEEDDVTEQRNVDGEEPREVDGEEVNKMEIKRASPRSPSAEVEQLQTQMRGMAKAMVQLKAFIEQRLRAREDKEDDQRNRVVHSDSPTSSGPVTTHTDTASGHRGETARCEAPLSGPEREGQSTPADAQPLTTVSGDA